MRQLFNDRADAGARLADAVARLDPTDPVVLALPRGGVPVAMAVARRLSAPLDLILVRKIGVPGHEELAAGAVVDGDSPEVVFNDGVLRSIGRRRDDFREAIAVKLAEIGARRVAWLSGRAPVPLAGRSAVVVDDGIATGATVRAALKAVRRRSPAEVILAVPVAPRDTLQELAPLADRIVCLERPEPFIAVGGHYRQFAQVSDAEVADIMKSARGGPEEGRDDDA